MLSIYAYPPQKKKNVKYRRRRSASKQDTIPGYQWCNRRCMAHLPGYATRCAAERLSAKTLRPWVGGAGYFRPGSGGFVPRAVRRARRPRPGNHQTGRGVGASERGAPVHRQSGSRYVLQFFGRCGGRPGTHAGGSGGGIYSGGGIVPRMGERFDASPLRARFEDKGRFKPYLQKFPTWVIRSPVSPALQGASQALSLGQC